MIKELLNRIEILENDAKEYGFYWESHKQIMAQIISECAEIEELLVEQSIHQDRLQEEIGDLLHAAISLCVYCKYDTYETLELAFNKFQKRYNKTKELAKQDGHLNLHGKTVTEMMEYWNKAKLSTK